ncbi:amino acid ABC transporter permease [Planktomarina temperata]|nr:amino acid ABC transporter permease [Planktomarina temperata]MDA9995590.1 amino acid ABC transporter permease [Planktomarina temperata]
MFEFRFYEIWRSSEYLETLFYGIVTSFWLTVVGSIIGFAMGIVLALAQAKNVNVFIRYLVVSYIEFVRNTPFIVQLFFVVFGLPLLLNYHWSLQNSALLAIVLNFSAYFGEVTRAGIDAVPTGQTEGAFSLGMTKRQTILDVILPQALANVYPSLTSQFVFLFLTTGLVSEIGVQDLTWAGRFVADRTFRDFEVFITLTILYMLMVYFFMGAMLLIKRMAFPWWGLK